MLYSKYKQLAEQKGLQIPAHIYMTVAVFYCRQLETDKVLSVLRDLDQVRQQRMYIYINLWMGRWMDELMDGWMNG